MTAPAPAPAAPAPQAQQPPRPLVPFIDGTYEFREIISTQVVTPGAVAQDLQSIQIIPGGFLRGVGIYASSAGGSQGTGVIAADAPWTLFSSLTLESIDGTPLLYPMSGYSWYLVSRYCRPWAGDPALDSGFATLPNPSFRMSFSSEGRGTLGVLPNTDARAQYRIRATIGTIGQLYSTVGTAVAPAVTLTFTLETYAQPPRETLSGAPIQPTPDGVGMQRFVSAQFDNTNTGTFQVRQNRTGNLIRTLILVFRDSAGLRTDLTQDPIRFRVDNTQMFVENRAHRDYEMWKFFQDNAQGPGAAVARPTGVYVYPRWQKPDAMQGVGWLETTPATFLQFELNGGAAGGSCQTITEDLAPVLPVPGYLENI